MIRPAELIERKRDGGELDADEIAELVVGYARDEVPDYQMAAFCMAVFFRGLTPTETFAFTDAMVRSGDTLDLHAALGRTVVDKHSTGGVGDKTTIAVGPIVAACGVPFGKMSGRGLGHTGGTLVFVNLVETDMLWGHRNDPVNFHRCLQDFDRRLTDILDALRPGDLLVLTSDHGCDPTTPSTDHTREHALLLAYAEGRNANWHVHQEGEFADVGATVNAWLGGKSPGRGIPGRSIYDG